MILLLFGVSIPLFAQDVTLFQQFNGRYDYTAIGNTLNVFENGPGTPCTIQSSSSASLNLLTNQNIVAAYEAAQAQVIPQGPSDSVPVPEAPFGAPRVTLVKSGPAGVPGQPCCTRVWGEA